MIQFCIVFPIAILRRRTWTYKYINLHFSWIKLKYGETIQLHLHQELNERNPLRNITKRSKLQLMGHKTPFWPNRSLCVWYCVFLYVFWVDWTCLQGSGLQCCGCSFRLLRYWFHLRMQPIFDHLVFPAGT